MQVVKAFKDKKFKGTEQTNCCGKSSSILPSEFRRNLVEYGRALLFPHKRTAINCMYCCVLALFIAQFVNQPLNQIRFLYPIFF